MVGTQFDINITNLTGLAASWKNPGVLFALSDLSQPFIAAMDTDGSYHQAFFLQDPGAIDFQDMSVGPCPSGTCLYLADIGGKVSASRVEFAIFRFAEPTVSGTTVEITSVAFERFRFAYPDGANHDAASMLVDPKAGTIYVITKVGAGKPSTAYALPQPLSSSAVNVARKVADLAVPRPGDMPAVGASAHPCGLGFLLRTRNATFEFRVPPGAAFETAFAASPVVVPSVTEPQAEAISYRYDGRGYVTSGGPEPAPIFEATCP